MTTRVVNLKLDQLSRTGPERTEFSSGPGRAGQAKIFKWTGPGRYGPKFQVDLAEPGRTVRPEDLEPW